MKKVKAALLLGAMVLFSFTAQAALTIRPDNTTTSYATTSIGQ